MSNEHSAPNQNQPDALLTPQAQAAVNAMIAASVREAVAAVFQNLQPVLKDMALSPEKLTVAIREANRPVVTPEAMALKLREERESLKSREDERVIREQTAARQASCPHRDKNERSSIRLCHNHPDHQVRGICVLCHAWITPREWRIAATEEEAAKHQVHKGKAFLAAAHACYDQVLQLESMS